MWHEITGRLCAKICLRSLQFHALNGFFCHEYFELEFIIVLRRMIKRERTRGEAQRTISISFTFRFSSLYFAWYFSSSTPAAMPVAYCLLFCLTGGVRWGGCTNIWEGRAEGPGDWLWDMMAVLLGGRQRASRHRVGIWFINITHRTSGWR